MVFNIRFVILRWLLIAAAIAGCYYSVLLARAAHVFEINTAESVATAVRLVPDNARYVARLANWEPDQRVRLLRRALDLNPFDSESWIQLGLAAELDGSNLQTAERYYLRAAQVDHMFLPKWTLTNFYFRRQKKAEFFRWAEATLVITPYSPDPVFTQMWLASQDAARIGAAIPERPRTLLQYAWFLSRHGKLAAVPSVVARLVRAAGPDGAHTWGRDDLLAGIQDRLLSAGDSEGAIDVWTSLQHAGWIGENIPTAAHPLTNGDFAVAFYKHGFDWRPGETEGVEIEQFMGTKSVRVTFSGDQPESCVLLRQYLPLEPGRKYRMRWTATPDRMNTPSGLVWRVRPAGIADGASVASGDLLAGQDTTWDFKAPGAGKLCLLTLEYKRPAGTVRARGELNLKSLWLAEQ